MNILIIPGNPPVDHFYQQWCAELKTAFPKHDFHAPMFPDFGEGKTPVDYLELVVSFYENQLLSLLKKNRNKKLLILGHSVGCYIALQLLQRLPKKVTQCIFFFPFLGRPSFTGRLILNSLYLFNVMGINLEKKIARHQHRLKKIIPDLQHLSQEEINAAMRFAPVERQTIARIRSRIFFQDNLDGKVISFVCKKDKWCPPWVIRQLMRYTECSHLEVSHDFVVSPSQRKKINTVLEKTLN